MFVLLLRYIKPIEEVDALMREHVAWLGRQYDAGRFVVSGRQIPRTGGVIVARGDDRKEMEADGAGRAIHTVFVDDLDARVADIASRGIEPGERVMCPGKARKPIH